MTSFRCTFFHRRMMLNILDRWCACRIEISKFIIVVSLNFAQEIWWIKHVRLLRFSSFQNFNRLFLFTLLHFLCRKTNEFSTSGNSGPVHHQFEWRNFFLFSSLLLGRDRNQRCCCPPFRAAQKNICGRWHTKKKKKKIKFPLKIACRIVRLWSFLRTAKKKKIKDWNSIFCFSLSRYYMSCYATHGASSLSFHTTHIY